MSECVRVGRVQMDRSERRTVVCALTVAAVLALPPVGVVDRVPSLPGSLLWQVGHTVYLHPS